MKKSLVVLSIVLFACPVFVGCKSGFGSCFTRNGSRTPTTAIAETGAVSSTVAGPVVAVPYNEVPMMQASTPNSTCDPCAPNACDPCGTSRGTAGAAYPSGNVYPGI